MNIRLYTQKILPAAMLCLVLAGCAARQKKAQKTDCVNVKTIRADAGSHAVGKNYEGTIEEEDGANVAFGVVGTVVRVMVDEGQFVRKGQALAEVDGENVRSAHEISAATLSQAEDAYRRLKDLYDKGTLPEIKMVEMETNLAKARAAEAMARKSVGEIVLRAPFDGYVASSGVHEGASVVPGMTGFRLVKIDRVKVRLSVPEKEIGRVAVGQQVTLTVDALGDSVFSGRIVSRGVTASPVSHAYGVKALVDNRRHLLLPGMVCRVRMENREGCYAIVIPQQAVQVSGHDKFVWTVSEGKAQRKPVVTGEILNEGVVIESGLASGDMVITAGQNKVCEGTNCRIEELKN